jgi:hypothetical protein
MAKKPTAKKKPVKKAAAKKQKRGSRASALKEKPKETFFMDDGA